MQRGSVWGRLAMVSPRPREAPHGCDFTTNVMHTDSDAICPKCLSWVTPTDIVRRTAYGLIQHEACSSIAPTVVEELSPH
ncbi:MAG: hypothetical protein JO214_11150 [Frankiaceae bacterium]|nr:hypothetical protein [Frankiaceae bacterium]